MIRRIAVFVISAGMLALPSFSAHAAGETRERGRDATVLARERLDAARTQATEIAGRISAAQTEQATLQAEIAAAEQRIPILRAKAAELRMEVKARAALLYVRHGGTTAFESTMDAENTQDGLRAAHLTNTIGAHDLQAATDLRETAARLAAREVELEQRRAELQRTLAELAPLNDLLQKKLQVANSLYEKVKALVDDGDTKHGVDVATDATACPVNGFMVFTDDFGELRPGGPHTGIDIAALPDTPVVAVADGLWRRDISEEGGNGAWLTGLDNVSYYYAHLSRHQGDGGLVLAGEVIGYVGSTGHSTGPHLHFEIHAGKPGEQPAVDPFATLLALCNDNLPMARAN